MAAATETKKKPAGTGGNKGQAILAAIGEHPDWSRAQIAEHVGCTPQRVGEVVRAAGIATAKPAKNPLPAVAAKTGVPDSLSDKALYGIALDQGMSSLSDGQQDRVRAYAKRGKKRMPK